MDTAVAFETKMRAHLAELTFQVIGLQVQVEARTEDIGDLKQQVEAKDAEIATLKKRLEKANG